MSIRYLTDSTIPHHFTKIDNAPKLALRTTYRSISYNLAGKYSVKGDFPNLLIFRGAILSIISGGFLLLLSKNVRENWKGRQLQVIYLPESKPKIPTPKIPKPKIPTPKIPSSKNTSTQMDDQSIIQQLTTQGFGLPEEKGGGGRCLFLSIAPQLTEADFAHAISIPHLNPLLCSFPEWINLSAIEQADLLRTIALEAESHFFRTLPVNPKDLIAEDLDWIRELFKDMIQELKYSSFDDLRKQVAATSDLEKFEFCNQNFETYKKRTIRPHNWAGTSELIALSKVFNRQTMAYGQDYASSEKVLLDSDKNVLPYYHRQAGKTPPIVVFQLNGGGHYRLLPFKAK